MKWSDIVYYQGRRVNRGTLAIIEAANILLSAKKFGNERSPLTLVQGSYNGGGVSASAGTHDGGGAGDTSAYNVENRERVFRLLGTAYYHRKAVYGLWNAHGHFIVDGDGTASAGAKRQVLKYRGRKDALASNGPDTGYKMLVFPLFVAPWRPKGKTGVFYIKHTQKAFHQPTRKSQVYKTLSRGKRFTVIARVRVGKTYWAVNPNGLFVPASALSARKPQAAQK